MGSEPGDDITFTGELQQRFDGENCYAKGIITIDGQEHELLCSTSGRSIPQYKLDGENLTEGDQLAERIEMFLSDIWPPEDGDWDAHVEKNIILSAPTPVSDDEEARDIRDEGGGQHTAPSPADDDQPDPDGRDQDNFQQFGQQQQQAAPAKIGLLDFLKDVVPDVKKGVVTLVRESEEGEEPFPLPDGAKAYVDAHPEGSDRGGYCPFVELADGQMAFYYEPDGTWQSA
jgi:hypothetical protein